MPELATGVVIIRACNALAERASESAVISFFFVVSHAFLAKTVETGDKNCGDFHCMQMSQLDV